MSFKGDTNISDIKAKIEELKYQYDQYFSGNRRTEPALLMSELEREILQATKVMATKSTMVKYQLNMLAHRFRSFQTQIKRLLERRDRARVQAATDASGKDKRNDVSLYIDKFAMNNPEVLNSKLRQMCELHGGASCNPENVAKALFDKASKVINRSDVAAVKFTMSAQDSGSAKVKGDIIQKSKKAQNS